MLPVIEPREALWVLGVHLRANPFTTDYPALWARFEAQATKVLRSAVSAVRYGVYVPLAPDMQDIYLGAPVAADAPVGEDLALVVVPQADYAMVETEPEQIGNTWCGIYHQWLPGSGYELDDQQPALEEYFREAETGERRVRILVPVRAKA